MIQTPRLILRQWQEADLAPFAALNADPRVADSLGGALTREQSNAMVKRIQDAIEKRGWGFWAVEVQGGPFVGMAGLSQPAFDAPFTPCTEIGWRLAYAYWGHGYAKEAARAALAYAFGELKLPEVVAFTAVGNARSRRVMNRLGMSYDPADDFDHPNLAAGHPLRRHVLYRIRPPID